ncbi:urease accessory protein UreD [Arenibaculum pallidiluteum]|uniref:urease accessory protein UreD n=1 Tax=Arenibaculum pallidiluteum TaxID=2812559 RepID=UPI001A976302|nr:urease accessory protein UreD [Arenibaculum pallidiluteum]
MPVSVPAPARLRVHGTAEVAFRHADGASRLAHLYQHDPLKVLFPTVPAGEPPWAVLVTTSGGMVGGDRLDVRAEVRDGAEALVTTQAAEKVYRSAEPDCLMEVALAAGPGGALEWLPQETILFDQARLRRTTRADLSGDARLMAGEMLVFGRTAMGERFRRGLARDAWEIRRDGRLVWADAQHLDGGCAAVLDDPACYGGAVATGTILCVGPGAAGLLDRARDLLDAPPDGVRAAAGIVEDILLVRWLGREARAMRGAYGAFWAGMREAFLGRPARLPRLWHV